MHMCVVNCSWSPNPFVRTSVWISFFSLANFNWQIYSGQAAMMRYTALDSMHKAKMYVSQLSQ